MYTFLLENVTEIRTIQASYIQSVFFIADTIVRKNRLYFVFLFVRFSNILQYFTTILMIFKTMKRIVYRVKASKKKKNTQRSYLTTVTLFILLHISISISISTFIIYIYHFNDKYTHKGEYSLLLHLIVHVITRHVFTIITTRETNRFKFCC